MLLPDKPLEPRNCPYCGTALPFHQRLHPGYCGAWECGRKHAHVLGKQRTEAWLTNYHEKTAAAVDQMGVEITALAEAEGIDPERVHIGTVPEMNTPLVPLPQDRKDAHLAHLTQIIDEAFAQPATYQPPAGRNKVAEQAEPFLWNPVACGTCRGDCCSKGRDVFAFQTVDTILHLRLNKPDMTAEDIYQHYADALPDTSVEDACVYQGPQGCVLTREMRADICNSFRCYSLRRLAEDVDRDKSDAVAIVSLDYRKAGRVTLFPLATEDS